eukprot:9243090-Alexandrium_andersonii.AAC.1
MSSKNEYAHQAQWRGRRHSALRPRGARTPPGRCREAGARRPGVREAANRRVQLAEVGATRPGVREAPNRRMVTSGGRRDTPVKRTTAQSS